MLQHRAGLIWTCSSPLPAGWAQPWRILLPEHAATNEQMTVLVGLGCRANKRFVPCSRHVKAKDLTCLCVADCLKDLQRFLRKDDPDTRPVFFKLGGFHLAANDLVPLVVTYPTEHEVVYNARECFQHICCEPARVLPVTNRCS
jgi:hypothetical protein